MKNVILVGAGGHCRSCIDVIEAHTNFDIKGIVGRPSEVGQTILGYPVEYHDDDLESLTKQDLGFLITVGQIKTNQLRVELFDRIRRSGGQFVTVVSPRAHVSKHAKVGAGTIVMHDALVNAAAMVGENCIINSKSLIEHDAVIGDHCHVSTRATINGGTTVNSDCFVGSGATLHQNISIAANSIIGSNAVVTRNIDSRELIRSNETR